MAVDDDSSELSSLSSLSPAPSDDELDDAIDDATSKSKQGILSYFPKLSEASPKEPSPPPRKRSPSPPHEYVLADNPDIAFIVMFRSRFSDAFPKSLANFGPQDLERDVVQSIPGDRVEHFLCATLGLLLNRKQDIKPGHYGRALEDAINTHKSQWATSWEGKSPLANGASFNSMDPTQRLTLLRTLILWSLSSSESVKGLINQAYKQNRHEDDLNQPRSVQPWGTDGDKRRYFLIEGQDDTAFRVYRESNPQGTNRTWWSVAGSIEELKVLAEKLETKDGGPKATKFAQKIASAMPRFEAGEEKRKRREYRQMQKERFKRPEPGFSMYEGRTRGKRIKYTYSDDEDVSYSDSTTRRSARNTGTNTPVEVGPVTTSSGRQIKAPSRLNVATGDSASNSVKGESPEFEESSIGPDARPKRSAANHQAANGWSENAARSGRDAYGSDEEESEGDMGDDEEDADEHVPEESDDEDDFDEDEAMVDDDLDDAPQSFVVKLSVTPPKLQTALKREENQRMADTVPVDQTTKSTARASGIDETEGETGKALPSQQESSESPSQKALAPPQPLKEVQETAFTPKKLEPAVEKSSTPPAVSATSLAFRGSPEKPHDQSGSLNGRD